MLAVQGAPAANTSPTTTASNFGLHPAHQLRAESRANDKQVDFLAQALGYRLLLSHADAVMALDRGVAVRMRPVGG